MWRLNVLVLTIAAGACASSGATPRPFPSPAAPAPAPAPGPSSTVSRPSTAAPAVPVLDAGGYAITGTALSLRGTPYRNGGADPSGFDCSGFVWYVFGQHGIRLPRRVEDQYRAGKDATGTLEPGDLVFFDTAQAGPSHVGILIGGDEFVHAPSSAGQVRVEHISASYWSARYVGARRVN